MSKALWSRSGDGTFRARGFGRVQPTSPAKALTPNSYGRPRWMAFLENGQRVGDLFSSIAAAKKAICEACEKASS